jgi:hypothetical protein
MTGNRIQEHLQPRVVVTSLPHLKTHTVYKTNTLKLIEERRHFPTS